jgi:hypothetical protein
MSSETSPVSSAFAMHNDDNVEATRRMARTTESVGVDGGDGRRIFFSLLPHGVGGGGEQRKVTADAARSRQKK